MLRIELAKRCFAIRCANYSDNACFLKFSPLLWVAVFFTCAPLKEDRNLVYPIFSTRINFSNIFIRAVN